jgi:hypothetical protein
MTNKFFEVALISLATCTSGYAIAKGTAPVQNHHCKLADGSMDTTKTHKECTAAKGTWVKDAATAPAAKTPAPSTSASAAPSH